MCPLLVYLVCCRMTISWPAGIEPYLIDRMLNVDGVKSALDVLLFTDVDLAKSAGISLTSSRHILYSIAKQYAPVSLSAQELFERADRVSSSIAGLDEILAGGFEKHWLVELVGESGSGKTQMCLTVAAQALRTARKVFWIDTEGTFRPERLLEILGGDETLLASISVCRAGSLSDLLDALLRLRESVKDASPCPLIFIDSVAAAARAQGSALVDRNQLLHRLAQISKSTAAVTLVTNHVMANLKAEGVVPALGNTWAHSVTCRLRMNMADNGMGRRRWIETVKCPTTPVKPDNVFFRICKDGIQPE